MARIAKLKAAALSEKQAEEHSRILKHGRKIPPQCDRWGNDYLHADFLRRRYGVADKEVDNELIAAMRYAGYSRRRGRPPQDNRNVINGVLWRLRTGASWRDVPEKYSDWSTSIGAFRGGESPVSGRVQRPLSPRP